VLPPVELLGSVDPVRCFLHPLRAEGLVGGRPGDGPRPAVGRSCFGWSSLACTGTSPPPPQPCQNSETSGSFGSVSASKLLNHMFTDVIKRRGGCLASSSQAMTAPPPLAFRGTKVRFAPKPSSIEFWGHLPPCEIGLWASGSKYSVAVKFGPISILKTKHDSFPTRGSNGSLSGHSTSPSASLQHTTQDTVSE
jgi:hypothetical protein